MKLCDCLTASIDTETTGVNTETDRIITLAIHRSDNMTLEWRFNPGIPIPASATAIHGIDNEMVKGWQPFASKAEQILQCLKGVQAYIGFNIYGFDLLIIMAELARAGVKTPFPEPGVLIIDAGTIFKKKEPRTLVAAVKKYCNREHEDAHGATADAIATANVLSAQIALYDDLREMEIEDVAKFSQQDGMVDYAGKLGKDAEGEVIYRIGKSRGIRVKDDPGMAFWMLERDFPSDTKNHLRRILESGVNVL